MDFRDGSQKRYWRGKDSEERVQRLLEMPIFTVQAFWVKIKLGVFAVELLWHILQFLVTVWYLVENAVHTSESYLISHGWLKKYKTLDVSKVHYLAIVVESEEARNISDVIELVRWVSAIGVKIWKVRCGVLKESMETIIAECNAQPWKGVETACVPLKPDQLTLEFTSVSDGKEGVVKAANLLFQKYQGDQDKLKFTESLLGVALQLVGYSGPEPDLLLVYGPTRCHLGFPAWRLRYTEIVHMGCLKSKKHGSLVKALYSFTTVPQNYVYVGLVDDDMMHTPSRVLFTSALHFESADCVSARHSFHCDTEP